MTVVLDASVLLKEIPNVLRFKRGIPEADVKTAMQAFWTLELETVAPTEPLLDEAIHLSFTTGLSLYDCSYLALARELNATLITADERLSRAAAKLVRTTVLR